MLLRVPGEKIKEGEIRMNIISGKRVKIKLMKEEIAKWENLMRGCIK